MPEHFNILVRVNYLPYHFCLKHLASFLYPQMLTQETLPALGCFIQEGKKQ